MKTQITGLFIFLLASLISFSQKIATLEVELSQPPNGLHIPVSVHLDAITFLADSSLSLVEVQNNKTTPVAFQIKNDGYRTLHWLVTPAGNTPAKRTYQLVKGGPKQFDDIKATVQDGSVTMQAGNRNLLRYQFKTVYPPAGVDTFYKKSGFIHPLWAPRGQELTRIQPQDHYHHYGIWNPWTHVLYEKDTVDFWNIGDKKATVRFANFAGMNSGPVFSEVDALHQHVVFKKNAGEKVALNELQTIKVYRPENNSDYYIADFISQMTCADKEPFHILAYRYAGFGWRTTQLWDNKNSEVLTSEGKNRKEADGSKARWVIVQGALNNDYGGAVLLSYPANYNHPEPLRIWPENQYNRGDMFANFAPTKDKDWLFEPGKTYTLKYRLVVFNGKFDKEKAESAWHYFAYPPKVTIKK